MTTFLSTRAAIKWCPKMLSGSELAVTIIPFRAFASRKHLIYVEFHDGVERIAKYAFNWCISLRSVKLLGIQDVGNAAFSNCRGLTEVEFGDKLETIGPYAFYGCISLRTVTMPSASVRAIGNCAFMNCYQLTDSDLLQDWSNRRKSIRQLQCSETHHHAIESRHDWRCIFALSKSNSTGPSWGGPQNCCIVASRELET